MRQKGWEEKKKQKQPLPFCSPACKVHAGRNSVFHPGILNTLCSLCPCRHLACADQWGNERSWWDFHGIPSLHNFSRSPAISRICSTCLRNLPVAVRRVYHLDHDAFISPCIDPQYSPLQESRELSQREWLRKREIKPLVQIQLASWWQTLNELELKSLAESSVIFPSKLHGFLTIDQLA